MVSYPQFEQVVEDLGDKVIECFSRSVHLTARDLERYRETHPGWVAAHSERGLANWVHDRLWVNLATLLDALRDTAVVSIVDQEPLREIWVGTKYRLRAKRHGEQGQVSSYPTQAALEFYIQQPALDGLEEVRLAVGYEWIVDARGIGGPVLSLRDGMDNVIWMRELPEAGVGGVSAITTPPTEPTAPTIGLPSEAGDRRAESDE